MALLTSFVVWLWLQTCPCQFSNSWIWHHFAPQPPPPLPPRAIPTEVLHLNYQITASHSHSEDIWELWGSVYSTCNLRLPCVYTSPLSEQHIMLCPKIKKIACKKISSKNFKWEAWPKPSVLIVFFSVFQALFFTFELQSREWASEEFDPHSLHSFLLFPLFSQYCTRRGR